MKFSHEHYDALRVALFNTLTTHGLHPYMVQTERHRWQCFHKACDEKRLDLNALYRNYTDDHIATAMRKIFKR